jgi:hypothetical protein
MKLPKIGKHLKNFHKNFWKGAKHFKIDAIIVIFTLIVIIYTALGGEVWLEGAAGILLVYVAVNVIRLDAMRWVIKKYEKLLDDNKIDRTLEE